ncbi:MAG: lipid A biosynthesis acyltransferase [Phycisphaeraceae bacterium]|nr:lipid A biosynthesis acyltransferase [Phycisphaeraceae bacterium]
MTPAGAVGRRPGKRRKARSPVILWAEYLAARTGIAALTCMNVEGNLALAEALGRLLYRCDRRHRERARDHLRIAFPDMSGGQIGLLARRSFEHFVKLAIEVCHAPRMLNAASWPDRVHLNPMAQAIELFCSSRPFLMVTGHLGNWEVLGYQLALLGVPISAIARPLDNPMIGRWLFGIRQQRGMRIITKWGAAERMPRELDAGRSLGFIADQNAGDRGTFVPFFGQLASAQKSIGLLALQRNLPIVCGYAYRTGPLRFEIGTSDVIYPDDWQSAVDPLYYVTARYTHAIERMAASRPEQYLWMHRRWRSRPRFERQGRPMPARLRRNLEALPWMDQATIDRMARQGEESADPQRND